MANRRPTFKQRVAARASPLYEMSVAVLLCICFICCVLAAFLYLIVLTVQLLTLPDPSCSLHNFYVPALNKFINSTRIKTPGSDSLIFFDLELQNAMKDQSVHYDDINLTFSYATNATRIDTIGKYTVRSFYQGKGKKAQQRDVAIVTGKVPWEETAMMALSNGSTVGFRMMLATNVKYKFFFWYTSKKRVSVGGNIEVDEIGKKVEKKPVNFKSGAAELWVGHLAIVVAMFVSVLM